MIFPLFLDPVALAIVGGGTLTAVALRTPAPNLRCALTALATLPRRRFDGAPLLLRIAALTRIAGQQGVARLDPAHINDPDIALAIAAAAGGASPLTVRALVRQAAAARSERHRIAVEVWTGIAEAAPILGMVGTLVEPARMLLTRNDPAAVADAMTIMLLTMLYGAMIGYLVALPVALRLRAQARIEAQERTRLEVPLSALAAFP